MNRWGSDSLLILYERSSTVKFLKIGGNDLGVFEILAFSIAAGSLSLALFSMTKVRKLEKKMKELEDK